MGRSAQRQCSHASRARQPEVEAEGSTIGELFADLDRRYPGLRFRVIDEQGRFRRHMRCFVGGNQRFDLGHPLTELEEVILVQALSGG